MSKTCDFPSNRAPELSIQQIDEIHHKKNTEWAAASEIARFFNGPQGFRVEARPLPR
jgi:hypothetical protein